MSPGSEKSRGAKYGNNAKKHKSGVVPDDLLLNRVRPQGMGVGHPWGSSVSYFLNKEGSAQTEDAENSQRSRAVTVFKIKQTTLVRKEERGHWIRLGFERQ